MNGLDTNILVRLFTRDDAFQAFQTERFLDLNCTAETPCFINRLVLAELTWVLRTGYRFPRVRIADAVEQLTVTPGVLVENEDHVLSALQLYRRSRADFADCLIGLVNRSQGCDATLTFDRAAAALPEFVLLTSR